MIRSLTASYDNFVIQILISLIIVIFVINLVIFTTDLSASYLSVGVKQFESQLFAVSMLVLFNDLLTIFTKSQSNLTVIAHSFLGFFFFLVFKSMLILTYFMHRNFTFTKDMGHENIKNGKNHF